MITQPYSVVVQGLGGLLLVTQGYSLRATTESVNPTSATLLIDTDATFTANFPSNWEVTGGSIVVAGDNLSAVFTAPGSPGQFTLTVTSQADPGNQVTVNLVVIASYALGTVNAGVVGTGLNAGQVGASQQAGADPPVPSPVLLPDLVAGWALTAGPQQTLDSTGVIAGGPLDWTLYSGSVIYASDGVTATGGLPELDVPSAGFDASLAVGDVPILLCATFLLPATIAVADSFPLVFAYTYGSPSDLFPWSDGGDLRFEFSRQTDQGPSVYVDSGVVAPGIHTVLGFYHDRTVFIQVDDGIPISAAVPIGRTFTADPQTSLVLQPRDSHGQAIPVKYMRYWRDANALVIANNAAYRSWLANVVAGVALGRSDAEVAAYTG